MQNTRRRTARSLGAPSDSDLPSVKYNLDNPSSSSSSSRTLPMTSAPSLTAICIRHFCDHFVALRSTRWTQTSALLQRLPESLAPKILSLLSTSCPGYLPHEVIVTHFLRGPSIFLSENLPDVKKNTILAIGRVATGLRELTLCRLDKIPDESFALIMPKLPALKVLVLRGCTKVSDKTVTTVAKSCPDLQIVNLNYTSPTPASISALVRACPSLKTLKIAGLSNWTSSSFSKLVSGIQQAENLPSLLTLKLRHLPVIEPSLSSILALCPNLQRLDISFTGVVHSPLQTAIIPPLEKLSLTSTSIAVTDLLASLPMLPRLKTISLGALGVQHGTIRDSSVMTLTDSVLRDLTAILENFSCLESLNLLGNTKLGASKTDSALLDFVTRVGRKCKWLNLSAIYSLRSFELSGLITGDEPSCLETLILNNTGIDDDVAPFISNCPDLVTLEVCGTKMTKNGLFYILDSCSKLQNLDLTSCRGVSVIDRRRFFQIWEQERALGA